MRVPENKNTSGRLAARSTIHNNAYCYLYTRSNHLSRGKWQFLGRERTYAGPVREQRLELGRAAGGRARSPVDAGSHIIESLPGKSEAPQ